MLLVEIIMNLGGDKWVLKVYRILILFLATSSSNTEAGITLVPSRVAYVCLGGRLELTCSTNASLMQWSVTVPRYELTETRRLQYSGTARRATSIIIGSITFNISRTLDESMALPLISTIITNSVTTDINGTLVNCSELGTNTQLTTRIHIIGSESIPSPPNITTREGFGMENVTVTLDWKPEMGMSYNVIINPNVPVKFVENTSIQLVVSYNTLYNVSVVATSCGHSNVMATVRLSYVYCSSPVIEESIDVVGYTNPALEGTTITLTCPSGLELTGPNTSTCVENREWEPDPKTVVCKANCGPISFSPNSHVLPYTSTLEGAIATITCKNFEEEIIAVCNQTGNWEVLNATGDVCTKFNTSESSVTYHIICLNLNEVIAIASSFVASSIFLLSFGFALGYCFGKKQKSTTNKQSTLCQDTTIENNDLQLRENAAYAIVQNLM